MTGVQTCSLPICFPVTIARIQTTVVYDLTEKENLDEKQNKKYHRCKKLKKVEEQIKMATKIGKSIVDESTGELISR